jgi:hypothetical protein
MKLMTGKDEILEIFFSSPAVYLLIPSELPKWYVTSNHRIFASSVLKNTWKKTVVEDLKLVPQRLLGETR